jgi:hypothetical protein
VQIFGSQHDVGQDFPFCARAEHEADRTDADAASGTRPEITNWPIGGMNVRVVVATLLTTDTYRRIQVIDIRSDDAETTTNAPQGTLVDRKVGVAGIALARGNVEILSEVVFAVSVIERCEVALNTPKECSGLELTSCLAAAGEPLVRVVTDLRSFSVYVVRW